MTTFTDVTISDSHADDNMRGRVVVAANAFAARHNLSADEVNAILMDADHPLFDELDGALSAAATDGFADEGYIVGEIHSLR